MKRDEWIPHKNWPKELSLDDLTLRVSNRAGHGIGVSAHSDYVRAVALPPGSIGLVLWLADESDIKNFVRSQNQITNWSGSVRVMFFQNENSRMWRTLSHVPSVAESDKADFIIPYAQLHLCDILRKA